MVLGEFEFNDLYANNSTGDVSALIFTMILLVALILLGSLVMVNLLVAIIVSDLRFVNKGRFQVNIFDSTFLFQ